MLSHEEANTITLPLIFGRDTVDFQLWLAL